MLKTKGTYNGDNMKCNVMDIATEVSHFFHVFYNMIETTFA